MEEEKYPKCFICKKVRAVPMHVKAAHGMSWSEYEKNKKDPEFLKALKKAKTERDEKEIKEFQDKKILLKQWFRPGLLTSLMKTFTDHHRGNEEAFVAETIDLSEFKDKTDAIVTEVEVAEALERSGKGWVCVTARGGRSVEVVQDDGTVRNVFQKKQYVLKRNA
jgi:hypothetical protein